MSRLLSFVGDRQRAVISGVAAKPIMVDVLPNSVALKIGDRIGLTVDPSAPVRLRRESRAGKSPRRVC